MLLANKHHDRDPLWHIQVVLLGVIILQLLLPEQLVALPRFLMPGFEFLCLIALQITTPKRAVFVSKVRRIVVFALVALIAVANATSLQLVIAALIGADRADAPSLLLSAVGIYITNIVVFAIIYWDMDGGGPGHRRSGTDDQNDFLYPQQQAKTHWQPTFVDYMYVSITNATAFSPTDTLPLSRRAKMLMAIQAVLSLLVVAVVAARAINIL